MIYTMGITLLLMSGLLYFEVYEIFKTKKSYNFMFYFSYYSLTIFFTHNVMYFFFPGQLTIFVVLIYTLTTIILWGLLMKWIYHKFGPSASIKVQVGKLAAGIVKKIEEKNKRQ